MRDVFACLSAHPIFSLASRVSLETVALSSAVRAYETGGRVALLGNEQTHVLVLVEGALRLYRKNTEVETEMLVGIVEAPAVFGDAELYSGTGRWSVSVRADSATVAVSIENAAFDRLVAAEGAVAHALYRDASARHFLAVQLMQVFALQKTQNKILRLLANRPADLSITQVELARTLGVNARTIARHLKELEAEGLLRRDGDRIELTKAFEARRLAAGLGASWRV